jgi:Cadmium resistance transporter
VLVALNIASRAESAPKRWEIWAGQFVGIGLLALISFLAALGLSTVAVRWVGLVGLIPLLRGIQGLARLIRGRRVRDLDPPSPARGLVSVIAITVANGCDNIALYTPAFRIMGAGGGDCRRVRDLYCGVAPPRAVRHIASPTGRGAAGIQPVAGAGGIDRSRGVHRRTLGFVSRAVERRRPAAALGSRL